CWSAFSLALSPLAMCALIRPMSCVGVAVRILRAALVGGISLGVLLVWFLRLPTCAQRSAAPSAWGAVAATILRCLALSRVLAADGPKLGQGRRPNLGIGAQDERLAAKFHGTQSAGAYLLIRRLTADPIRVTKVFERQSRRMHFSLMFVAVVVYLTTDVHSHKAIGIFIDYVFACAPISVATFLRAHQFS